MRRFGRPTKSSKKKSAIAVKTTTRKDNRGTPNSNEEVLAALERLQGFIEGNEAEMAERKRLRKAGTLVL